MKKILVIIFLINFQIIFSQNPIKFDSLVFNYNYSTSGLRKNTYISETLKINQVDGSFFLSNKKVDSLLVNQLWIELNKNSDNFTYNYFLSKKLKVKKSKIKKNLNFYNQIVKSQNKKMSQNFKDNLITDILNLKGFSKFIEIEKPKKDGLYGHVDSSETVKVYFFYNGKNSFFEFETFHYCGQPFYNGEKRIENKMVNLDVNQVIMDILPNKSKFRKKFIYQNIIDKYINWYVLKEIEKEFPQYDE